MPTIEEIAALLDNKIGPLQEEIRSLKTKVEQRPALPNDAMAERKQRILYKQAEYEKWINEAKAEVSKMDDHTWVTPEVSIDNIVVSFPQGGGSPKGGLRFRPETMPKYRFGDDIERWKISMDHVVRLWDEKVVCPHIHTNCFIESDTVQTWYLGQDPIVHQALTEDVGCWNRFKNAMTVKWAKSEGIRQDEADNRRKLPTETYTQYFIEKKHLCRLAYKDAADATIIVKIRSKLDREASHFCREKQNLERFLEEIIEYDESIGLFNSNNISSSIERKGKERAPERIYSESRKPQARLAIEGAPSSEPQRQDPQQRRDSVKDRLNPESNKMTRSFTDRRGNVIFIDRPCDKCTARGKTFWHFRFECPEDPKLKAFLTQHERGEQIEGLSLSPSGAQTSYTFTTNPFGYASKLAKYDDGYSSDESGNGQGDQ